MAVELKRCTFDPMLVKQIWVLEAVDFSIFKYLHTIFSCLLTLFQKIYPISNMFWLYRQAVLSVPIQFYNNSLLIISNRKWLQQYNIQRPQKACISSCLFTETLLGVTFTMNTKVITGLWNSTSINDLLPRPLIPIEEDKAEITFWSTVEAC